MEGILHNGNGVIICSRLENNVQLKSHKIGNSLQSFFSFTRASVETGKSGNFFFKGIPSQKLLHICRQNRTEQNRTDRTEQNRTEQNRTEQNRTDRTEQQNRTEQKNRKNRIEQNRTEDFF